MSIVPSLETCKRLKECGWNKPTIFHWRNLREPYIQTSPSCVEVDWNNLSPDNSYISAPTLEEVLNELPKDSIPSLNLYSTAAFGYKWCCNLAGAIGEANDGMFNSSAVEAAAELYLHLHKKEE